MANGNDPALQPPIEWLLPTGWYHEGIMLPEDLAGPGPVEAAERPKITEKISLDFIQRAWADSESRGDVPSIQE